MGALQLHIPLEFPRRVRFALCRFRSPLLPASLLVSFPAGTRMFLFPAFPLPAGSAPNGAGSPIRGSRDRRLPAPPPGLSQLATPFVGARAEPSTRRAWWLGRVSRFHRDVEAYARPSCLVRPFTCNSLELQVAYIVDPVGFEPTASGLQGRRSPS